MVLQVGAESLFDWQMAIHRRLFHDVAPMQQVGGILLFAANQVADDSIAV